MGKPRQLEQTTRETTNEEAWEHAQRGAETANKQQHKGKHDLAGGKVRDSVESFIPGPDEQTPSRRKG